jgi:hypothetical protein
MRTLIGVPRLERDVLLVKIYIVGFDIGFVV